MNISVQKLLLVCAVITFSACSIQLPDEVQIKVKPEAPQSNAQIDVYVELPSHLDKVNAEITDASATEGSSSLSQPILLKVSSDADLGMKTYHYIVPALNEGVYLFRLNVVSPINETITRVLQVFPNANKDALTLPENNLNTQTTIQEDQETADIETPAAEEQIPSQADDQAIKPVEENSEENIPKDDDVTHPIPDNDQTATNPNQENPTSDQTAEIETKCNTACSNLFTVCAEYETYLTALTGLTQDSCKTQCGTNFDSAQGFMNCVSDTSAQCLTAAGCIAGELSKNN